MKREREESLLNLKDQNTSTSRRSIRFSPLLGSKSNFGAFGAARIRNGVFVMENWTVNCSDQSDRKEGIHSLTAAPFLPWRDCLCTFFSKRHCLFLLLLSLFSLWNIYFDYFDSFTTFQSSTRDEIGKEGKKEKESTQLSWLFSSHFQTGVNGRNSSIHEWQESWGKRKCKDNQRQEPLLNEDQNNYRVIKRGIPAKRTKGSNRNPFAQKLA